MKNVSKVIAFSLISMLIAVIVDLTMFHQQHTPLLSGDLPRYSVGSGRGISCNPDAFLWVRHHPGDDLLRLCGLRWTDGGLTASVRLWTGG